MFGLLAAAAAVAANPDVAVGRWMTETKHGIVEIDRCGRSICGKILSSDGIRGNRGLLDVNNKDPKLRGRRLLGLQILAGFTASDGAWTGGTIYNAEDGGTYHATVTPTDANHLKVRGCIFWPLCKSQVWTRVR
jgi:uncharacterized protein (DUF2147 family)